MSRHVNEVVEVALFHLELVEQYAARTDVDDQLLLDAVAMRLSAGVEALSKLEPEVRDRLTDNEWPQLWGMRNRIAHGYALVDAGRLRATLARRLPDFLGRLRMELKAGTESPSSAPRTD